MFSRLSLKYQIALTILVLVAAVLTLTLERTLSAFVAASQMQQAKTEQVILTLLREPSRHALLTEEYDNVQQSFMQAQQDPHVLRVLLADAEHRVVLSTVPADIGVALPVLTATVDQFWHATDITNDTGKLGVLAIEFATAPLLQAQRKARNLGASIAATGMILMALVGLGMGFVLTRRLERLTRAAQRLAAGEGQVATGLHGQDEVAQVGHAFDAMARQIVEDRQQLLERESRTRAILDTTVDAIITIDEQGIIESFNPAAERIFGYTMEEVRGQNIKMLMPSPYREEHDGYLAHYRDTGERQMIGIGREVIGRCKDGTTFPMDLSVSEVHLSNQRLFTGIVRDMTARQEAEAALRDSERRLAAAQQQLVNAIESLTEGFALYDAEDRLVLCNQKYREFYDVSADLLVPGARFEDHIRTSAYRGQIAEAIGREEEWVCERVVQHRNPPGPIEQQLGNGRWLLIHERPTREGGVVGVRTDITERKVAEETLRESEQRYRTLVEQSLQGISITRHGKRLFANPALATIFGYEQSADLIGQDVRTLIAPHEQARIAAYRQARSRGEPAPERYELQGVRKDGTYVWIENTASVIAWEGAPATMTTLIDITARKDAEVALQKAHDALEQRVQERTAELAAANEEVKRFAYIVSHDLRAPLVNLKGFARELRRACEILNVTLPDILPHLSDSQCTEIARIIQEDGPEALEFIDSSVTRMDALIQAVLNLSRIGNRELHLEPVNTEELVYDIVQSLTHQLTAHRATVQITSLPEIHADRTAMEQIFGNLLSNAVKYLEPGRPGMIAITAEQHDELTAFHVQDNGRGISEDDIPKVFELFRRVGKQDVEGEGMGLTYVQTLIRRHGGEIRCESALGVGTTFTFTISHDLSQGDTT